MVGGWVTGEGSRAGRIGALLIGYYDDDGALRYAGRVGTGFTEAELDRVAGLFSRRSRRPKARFARRGPAARRALRGTGARCAGPLHGVDRQRTHPPPRVPRHRATTRPPPTSAASDRSDLDAEHRVAGGDRGELLVAAAARRRRRTRRPPPSSGAGTRAGSSTLSASSTSTARNVSTRRPTRSSPPPAARRCGPTASRPRGATR